MEEQTYEQEPTTLVWIQPDFSTFCRVCANSNDYLIPIFKGEGLENQLKIKIERHLPMKICEDDTLPTQVCYQCASTLLAWHELVENCLNAEKRLQNLLEQQNNKIQESLKADNENETNFLDEQLGIITDGEDIDENIAPSASINDFQDSYCSDTDKLKQPVKKRLRVTTQKKNQEICEAIPKEEPPTENRGDVSEEQEKSDLKPPKRKKRKKKEKISMCTICGKVFKFIDNLKIHLISHSDSRPHLCDICGATFKRRSHVNHHKTTVHANHPDIKLQKGNKVDVPMTCDECGEIKKNKHALYIHKKKHNKSYICDVCGKCFALPSTLKAHMVLHSDDMPFTCDECGKSFKLKVRLQVHKQSHTENRPFACTICENKKFKTKAALNVHNNMHNDTRPFQCPHCAWRARKNSDLVCHIRTHTGEKPYKCEVCGRGFAQAGDMRKHRNTHDKYVNDHCYTNFN